MESKDFTKKKVKELIISVIYLIMLTDCALVVGLEPTTGFRQKINSLSPATNSGTLEHSPLLVYMWQGMRDSNPQLPESESGILAN